MAFMTMRSARARLCTAETPPSLRAGSWTTRAPSGTLEGCQHPSFIDGAGDPEQGNWPFPYGRRGEQPGSVSVYPAEKKASPGSNYDQVVNICWLNGVLSTGCLRSQPQPWKVQFSGSGKGEGKSLPTLFRGVCPGYVLLLESWGSPSRSGGRLWYHSIALGRQYLGRSGSLQGKVPARAARAPIQPVSWPPDNRPEFSALPHLTWAGRGRGLAVMRLREGRARSAVLVRAGPTTWTPCPGLGDVEVREVATSLGQPFPAPLCQL